VDEEFYSPEELQAFQRVGEFLCWFAMLEDNIGESIIDVLGLEPIAGRLLMTYVNFAAKCDFLKELISVEGLELTSEELKSANSTIGSIQSLNSTRITVVHSFFSHDNGGVKFLKGKKKLREDRSRIINNDEFIKYRNDMADYWGRVAQIASKIKGKAKQKKIAELMLNARLVDVTAELGSKPH
jgi:hypothetical protein